MGEQTKKKGGGPKAGGGGPTFRVFFSLSDPHFRSFSISGGLLVEFWLCLKRRDPETCTFGLSGCRVKPRFGGGRGPGRSTGSGGGGSGGKINRKTMCRNSKILKKEEKKKKHKIFSKKKSKNDEMKKKKK